jgi:Fanconi-associated nuclease 1
MNSSPPPPSFTLPPLTSAGRLPVTPDDSLEGYEGAKDHVVAKSKGKQRAEAIDDGDEVRISMYVRLFDGT